MRGLLNGLREPAGIRRPDRAPQPTLAAVPALADRWRAEGRHGGASRSPGRAGAAPRTWTCPPTGWWSCCSPADTGPVTVRVDLCGDPAADRDDADAPATRAARSRPDCGPAAAVGGSRSTTRRAGSPAAPGRLDRPTVRLPHRRRDDVRRRRRTRRWRHRRPRDGRRRPADGARRDRRHRRRRGRPRGRRRGRRRRGGARARRAAAARTWS